MKTINLDYEQGKEEVFEQFIKFDSKNKRQLHSIVKINAKLTEIPKYREKEISMNRTHKIIHTSFFAQVIFIEKNNCLIECVQN